MSTGKRQPERLTAHHAVSGMAAISRAYERRGGVTLGACARTNRVPVYRLYIGSVYRLRIGST